MMCYAVHKLIKLTKKRGASIRSFLFRARPQAKRIDNGGRRSRGGVEQSELARHYCEDDPPRIQLAPAPQPPGDLKSEGTRPPHRADLKKISKKKSKRFKGKKK